MKLVGTIVCGLFLLAAVSCGNSVPSAGECEECVNHGTECASGECEGKGNCKGVGSNAVVENIMSRRSIRNYKEKPVERALVEEVMKCGINAPNGQNKQSWEVRIVDDPAFQNEIKAAMAATGNERAAGCFYNAPVWLFIACDKSYDFSTIDCGLLSQNIMLSANALGLGTVCLGSPVRFILTSPDKDKVLSKLGFSDGYELCICIAMGYPNETPAAKPRDFGKVKFVD